MLHSLWALLEVSAKHLNVSHNCNLNCNTITANAMAAKLQSVVLFDWGAEISGCCQHDCRPRPSTSLENKIYLTVSGGSLIPVRTHSPYLSHCCFVLSVACFLTWMTEWRGQPGGDPHLPLWLLPQQPPDITNHAPAGGEREKVWQLFTQEGRGG